METLRCNVHLNEFRRFNGEWVKTGVMGLGGRHVDIFLPACPGIKFSLA